MTRQALAQIGSKKRHQYTATVNRYGTRITEDGFKPTLLLTNIKLNEQVVADHVWVELNSYLRKLGWLHRGDELQFVARVTRYSKLLDELGHQWTHDYKLSQINHVRLISYKRDPEPLPNNEQAFLKRISKEGK